LLLIYHPKDRVLIFFAVQRRADLDFILPHSFVFFHSS
jgi:hypothetical protein